MDDGAADHLIVFPHVIGTGLGNAHFTNRRHDKGE
jgi:hypothetical protein